MRHFSRNTAVIVAVAVAALAGCNRPSVAAGPPPPPAHVTAGPHGTVSVVLTPLGAQRAGIQTAVAASASRGGQAVVPYSALLYQPGGDSVIYTVTGPLTYTLVPVAVVSIRGNQVYLTGLHPGTAVVTVGGQELLGVQDGVGVQT